MHNSTCPRVRFNSHFGFQNLILHNCFDKVIPRIIMNIVVLPGFYHLIKIIAIFTFLKIEIKYTSHILSEYQLIYCTTVQAYLNTKSHIELF